MREIKFRGKSEDNSEWFYGFLQKYQEKRASRLCIFPVSVRTWKDARLYSVRPDTVGQFTGLHDKNDKEIYEGDVVANDFGNNNIVNMTVEWCADGYWALHEIDGDDTMHFVADYLKEIEVIGNIHDNPELLTTND